VTPPDNSSDQLILVDSADNEIGYEAVTACHYRNPRLHRAFSVFVFNEAGEMLITQRSSKKHTWPLFWSNACCSHPRKGQDSAAAASARLTTELGISASVDFLFKFEYRAQYDDDWGEHELDWVFLTHCNEPGNVNADEIKAWEFIPIAELQRQVGSNPDKFTPWFRLCLDRVLKVMQKQ
jgi:isopentenyl-diphosphate delta-isomerase